MPTLRRPVIGQRGFLIPSCTQPPVRKMLSADKNVTLTEFQIKTLQIREKELNYFVSLYNSISGKYHAVQGDLKIRLRCWNKIA